MRERTHFLKAEQPRNLGYMQLGVIKVPMCQIAPQLLKYLSKVQSFVRKLSGQRPLARPAFRLDPFGLALADPIDATARLDRHVRLTGVYGHTKIHSPKKSAMATRSMMAQVIIAMGKPASPPAPLLGIRFLLGTPPEPHCSVIRMPDGNAETSRCDGMLWMAQGFVAANQAFGNPRQ
jgi:hypothetical protein